MNLDTLTTKLKTLTRHAPGSSFGKAAQPPPPPPPTPDLSDEPEEAQTPEMGKLCAQYAHRNLLVSKSPNRRLANNDGIWAHFVLTGVDWPMKDEDHRAGILDSAAGRLAELIGHRCVFRGMSMMFPHQAYADRLRDDNPKHLPDVEGARTFDNLIDAMEMQTISLESRNAVSFLAVRLSTRHVDEHDLPLILGGQALHTRQGEIDKIRLEYQRVLDAVGRSGYEGRPMSAVALSWLMHASVGMGPDVPTTILDGDREGWTAKNVVDFTDPVWSTCAPYEQTVTVRTIRDLKEYTSHVAILHVKDFEPRNIDDVMPFLAWTQGLPFLVEYCAILDVVAGDDCKQQAELARRGGTNIAKHYGEHDEMPPAEVMRGIDLAADIEDEVTNGAPEISTRLRGVVMFAVKGPTKEETMGLVRKLIEAANSEQHIPLIHGKRQYAAYRAFTPGESYAMKGLTVQMGAQFFAAAVPNATAAFGDPTGFLIGPVAGSHELAILDTHGGSARDRSNMLGIGAGQGGGKSTFAFALADFNASCGVPTVLFDPAGPGARLCTMPHLKGQARHLPIASTSAPRGILHPYRMILDPKMEDYLDEPDPDLAFTRAKAAAIGERQELAAESLRDLLPVGMASGENAGRAHALIQDAVDKVGGDFDTDPWAVVAALEAMPSPPGVWVTGELLASALKFSSGQQIGSLVFPEKGKEGIDRAARLLDEAMLTVITMEGLTLPPKDQPDMSKWSLQAVQSVPAVRLASRFAMRAMYAGKDRKTIILDELGMSTGGASSFSSFAVRASTDSRKRNAFIVFLFQNPGMLLRLDPEISNLLGAAMIGRMEDAETARAALKLLRLDPDSGYHRHIMALQQGEFFMRDWGRRVADKEGRIIELPGRNRKVYVDRSHWHNDLRLAVDTNPYGEGTYKETLGGLQLVESAMAS